MRPSYDGASALSPGAYPANQYYRQEAELVHEVEQTIRSRTGRSISQLKVEVTPSEIVLHGRCVSFYGKQLAQHAAMAVAGKRQLNNQIEVVSPGED